MPRNKSYDSFSFDLKTIRHKYLFPLNNKVYKIGEDVTSKLAIQTKSRKVSLCLLKEYNSPDIYFSI